MSSVLVINAAGRETRVALVENGHIAEFYLERKKDKGIVGNIYKGRVVRVLPGMQAAFVDIGLEKAAFLYVSDVVYDPDFARAQFELTEGEHEELADVPEPDETDQAALPAGQVAALGAVEEAGANDTHVHLHSDEDDHHHHGDHGHDHADHDHDGHDHDEHEHADHGHDDAFALDHEPSITSEYAVLELESDAVSPIDFDAAARTGTPREADEQVEPRALLKTGSDDVPPTASGLEDAGAAGESEEAGAVDLALEASDEGDGSGSLASSDAESSDAADAASVSAEAAASDAAPANGAKEGQKEGRGRDRRRGKGEIRGEKRTPRDAREARQRDRNNGRKEPEKEKIKTNRETRIEDVLKVGQEVVVQISKDPIGTKGARLTSHISIPGRHLVFMPTVDHVGISRRIGNDKERKRLREIVDKLRPPGTGFIVRTVAEGVPSEKLESDIRFLIEIWNQVVRKNERRHGPGLMHSDLDLILRATRDLFAQDVEQLVVDDREEYERILSFVGAQDANLADRVRLHESEEPIFDAYGIEQELSRATQRKVWLKSGGYLIVDQAEALTAIDVNSGRYVGKKSLEETITKINVEAAKEIVYQLRLRNIGGIIICDFIDMEKAQNRDKVFKSLQEALGRDKAKTNVLRISELGLIEMTRKRVRESIGRMLHEDCAYCDGKGFVKTALTVAYEIFRDIRREAAGYKDQSVVINCSSEVARLLQGDERQELRHLMDRFNKTIQVRAQANYHREQYDIFGRTVQGNDYRITGSSGHFLGARRAEGHGDYALPASSNPGGDRGGRERDRERGGRGGNDRGGNDRGNGDRGGGRDRGGRDRGGRSGGGGNGGGRKDGGRGQQPEGRSSAPAREPASKE